MFNNKVQNSSYSFTTFECLRCETHLKIYKKIYINQHIFAPACSAWRKTWISRKPWFSSRFPCCVLSYFSLVFVMEHSRRWWLHIGGSKMFEPLFRAEMSFLNHFFCKIFVFDVSKLKNIIQNIASLKKTGIDHPDPGWVCDENTLVCTW